MDDISPIKVEVNESDLINLLLYCDNCALILKPTHPGKAEALLLRMMKIYNKLPENAGIELNDKVI